MWSSDTDDIPHTVGEITLVESSLPPRPVSIIAISIDLLLK